MRPDWSNSCVGDGMWSTQGVDGIIRVADDVSNAASPASMMTTHR